MSVIIAAILPRALPAARPLPVSGGPAADPPRAAAPMQPDRSRPGHSVAFAPIAPPVWPGPGAVNLAGRLIGLSETQITYTATLELPETDADFWAMLATALHRGEAE